jgi:hypothetical protein
MEFGRKRKLLLLLGCILHICSFGFLVGALDHDYWFVQKYNNDYDLEGKLLRSKDPSHTWSHLHDDCESRYLGDGFCDQLKVYHSAGTAYVVFDSFASAFTMLNILFLIIHALKIQCITSRLSLMISSYVLIVISCVHLLAFIIWAGSVKLRYDNCTFELPFNIRHAVCGRGGSALAIWTIFFLFSFSGFHFLMCRKIMEQDAKEKNTESYQSLG